MRDDLVYPPGALAVDADGEHVRCHICGGAYVNLAQHARRTHGLTAHSYRLLTGLNRTTSLLAPAYRARVRATQAPRLKRLHAEGRIRTWGDDPEWFAEVKRAAVETIREGMRPEAVASQRARWDDEQRAARAERTRQRNLSGELRAAPERISAGLKRYYAEHPEAIDHERLRQQLARARERMIGPHTAREMTCPRCGESFVAASHRNKYCDDCRPIVHREQVRQAVQRARARERAREASPPA